MKSNKGWEQIVFTNDYYDDRDAMYQAVATQVKLLMDNAYTCKIYDEDRDIVVVQYAHDNSVEDWGDIYLEWLTAEELELVQSHRDESAED